MGGQGENPWSPTVVLPVSETFWSWHRPLAPAAQGAIAILKASAVDLAGDQVAAGVGDDVALAALDLLACIEARK